MWGDQAPGTSARTERITSVLVELGFVAVALGCYLLVLWYTEDRTGQAIANAHDVLALERFLGIDWEHAVQDATAAVPGFSTFCTQFYVWGYFPTLAVVLVWLFVRHRETYRTLRIALLASGVVGLVVYALYPCAPPWIGGRGFTDTVAEGPLTAVARPSGITNHLGAIPSFHCGWLIMTGLIIFMATSSRLVRVLCVVHPALMCYAVVATGNHWVLDIPAGLALSAVGIPVAAYLTRRSAVDAGGGAAFSSATPP